MAGVGGRILNPRPWIKASSWALLGCPVLCVLGAAGCLRWGTLRWPQRSPPSLRLKLNCFEVPNLLWRGIIYRLSQPLQKPLAFWRKIIFSSWSQLELFQLLWEVRDRHSGECSHSLTGLCTIHTAVFICLFREKTILRFPYNDKGRGRCAKSNPSTFSYFLAKGLTMLHKWIKILPETKGRDSLFG